MSTICLLKKLSTRGDIDHPSRSLELDRFARQAPGERADGAVQGETRTK